MPLERIRCRAKRIEFHETINVHVYFISIGGGHLLNEKKENLVCMSQ